MNDHKRTRNNWKTSSFVDLRSGSRAGIEGPGITETLNHLSIFGPGSRAGIERPGEKWDTLLCVDLRSGVQVKVSKISALLHFSASMAI